MSMHPAARTTDRFGHAPGLGGIVAAVAAGAGLAVGGGSGLMAAVMARLMVGPETGSLDFGSNDVYINDLPAVMVQRGTGRCLHHGAASQPVITGSGSVFINGFPAARITDQLACGASIRTGSRNVFIGGPRKSPICTSLRLQVAKLEQFRIDAQAASAVYDAPGERKPPDGYRNATPEDLQRLGLSHAMLEHPINERTMKPSDFRAAVFMNQTTGAPLIAYKGTDAFGDMPANIGQNLGNETFYYRHAQRIARNVQTSPAGISARVTGHSLGGGLASAGSRATGIPATTFNAAGLHSATVPHPVPSDIDAVYVKGEALRGSQSIWGMSKSAASRTWPLEPASTGVQAYLGGIVRAGLLHMMSNVDAALAEKRAGVEAALVSNGCS